MEKTKNKVGGNWKLILILSILIIYGCGNNHNNNIFINNDSVSVIVSNDSIIRTDKKAFMIQIDTLRIREAKEELRRGNIVIKTKENIIGERLKEILLNDFGIIVEKIDQININTYNKVVLSKILHEHTLCEAVTTICKSKHYDSVFPFYMNVDSTYNLYVSSCRSFVAEELLDCHNDIIKKISQANIDINKCKMKWTDNSVIIQVIIDTSGIIKNPKIIYKLCSEIDNEILCLIDTVHPLYKPATLNGRKISVKRQWMFSWDALIMVNSCN